MKRHLTIKGCLIGCNCMVWLRIRFKVMVTIRKNVIGRLKAMGGLKVTNLAFGGNKMFVTRKDQQAV
ncbi:hypothetical protein ERO13_D07G119001v2 [Gossypium hirsutum]|uniref:Uncharacterized protein n=3 Tax=Gossypium TaxID=3633 RepID=A0A5J5QQU0_GOSBA|nr:hypothetical protein ES319_D07G127500v1 [Gossypium barbadense]KAG4138189.1 hypothetical protein ERO13_D07G119001v2 [Gossypium hirsutum]TYH62638.1 hypothetical protein ES332_D07G133400v1 [Gossypium tomentosum]TYI73470.1 hypothetical protein E1A91_D07G130700v1 [Gossypium mustelinum]